MCTAILFTILSCKHASANQSAPNYQLSSNDAMFSENLYVPLTLFSGSYVFNKARYSAGYSSSASLCGDVLQGRLKSVVIGSWDLPHPLLPLRWCS